MIRSLLSSLRHISPPVTGERGNSVLMCVFVYRFKPAHSIGLVYNVL